MTENGNVATDVGSHGATAPPRSGYVDVNGVHMYYEVSGEGSPVVLLHGGLESIDVNFGALIRALTGSHLVVAVEMQGHGRTADIDRPLRPATLAGDIIGLLDHLGIDRAHVVGHSLGGLIAFELAVNHPQRVRSIVPISAHVRPDGMHPDLFDPAKLATSPRMPGQKDYDELREAYLRLSPHPERFEALFNTVTTLTGELPGWSDEQLAGITAPTLVVVGDLDLTTVEHGALIMSLIPGAQLAVLPNTTHLSATKQVGVLGPILTEFLD